ncbi:MAG: hypothetical protein ACYDA8_06125 [Deferrisomatales bacterium]
MSFGRFRSRILHWTGLLGLAGTLALYAVGGRAHALGFGLGALTIALALHLHGAQVAAQARLPAPAAVSRARLGSLTRTGLRAAALALAFRLPQVSFGWAVAGLFAGPVALVLRASLRRDE